MGAGSRPGTLDVVAVVVALYSAAAAMPLLQLLGANPEFFVAHRFGGADIVIATALGVVVAPVLVGALLALVIRFHRPTGLALHGVVLVGLTVVLVMGTLKKTALAAAPWWAQAAAGLAAGGLAALGFHRSTSFRGVIRFGMLLPLVLGAVFLAGSRTSVLVMPAAEAAGAEVVFPAGAPPIVLMVFDEFPLASVIDGSGRIQDGPYPNLARLASTSTWYRNATTVSSRTTEAVPALLTGKRAAEGSVPILRDHPDNLFTWASSGYELRVVEPVTELCPESLCDTPPRPEETERGRWRSMLSDLRIVTGHVLLSDDLAARLPPIDRNWAGFDAGGEASSSGSEPFAIKERFAAARGSRRSLISDFVDQLGAPADRPTLDFAHILLPHQPWVHLPDGRMYEPVRIPAAGSHPSWSDDAWAVDQALQRHLSQVEYADRIIGMIIDRLTERGTFDETVLVVTADHGIAVRPGIEHRRGLEEETAPDIVSIPLLIKAPGQKAGVVDDYPAELTDVLPTIAEMAGAPLPWETDGISLAGEARPERPTRVVNLPTDPRSVEVTSVLPEVEAMAARRIEAFGPGGAFGLAPAGQSDLLGRGTGDLAVEPADRMAARILNADAYRDVDTGADGLPVIIRGQLRGRAARRAPGDVVAIATNGTISAVTRTYRTERQTGIFFIAMLDPDYLADGDNDVAVYLVSGTGAERSMRALAIVEPDG